jgi:acetolactate synthase-1/2/3 large subunit
MTGGRAVAEMMALAKVEALFGMGGFQLLPYYDGIRELGLRHVLINDERTGAFAADAYARVSGRVGVCDATLGPGATNLLTGLAECQNAGVPLVAVTGDTHRAHSWKNMTQETRQIEALRPVCKDILRIERVERVPELVRRAFAVASAGRGGPVVIDVPEDVAHAEHGFAAADFHIDPRTTAFPAYRAAPAAADIRAAAALLRRAKRPVLLVGGGLHLSQGTAELADLVAAQSIPVAHTLSGKGAIACTDPLSVGLFGRFSRIANDLIASSDCLLVVGCKLGEIATKRYALLPAGVPVIQLDSLAEEIGRTASITQPLWGDAAEGLRALAAELHDSAAAVRAARADYVEEIQRRKAAWAEEAAARYHSAETPINMGRLIGELRAALPADGIVVADGGFAAHWGGLLFDTQRAGRHFVANRGMASIGYGLPGALGAQLAAPNLPVVGLCGDGGFNMTLGDLETARRSGAGLIMVVINNAASGYVKALQHSLFQGRYQSSDLVEMNYAAIAQAMGCRGIRVEDPDALAGAFRTALADRSLPTVLDVVVTRDPARMLPAVDNRTLEVKQGDRPV